MTVCHICGLHIKVDHSLHELEKCLERSGVFHQIIDREIRKLKVLIG